MAAGSFESREGHKGGLLPDLLQALLFSLFILTFAIVFVLYFKPLFYLDIGLFHLEEESGMTAAVIRKNYDSLISYMYFWNRGPLILPNFAMSETGRIHFADCKRIFDLAQYVCLFSGLLFAITAFLRKAFLTSRAALVSGILLIGFPAFIALWALLDWEGLFIRFHSLCFQNDYWIFDPAVDPVILVLPDGFFLHCLILILVIVIGSGTACIIAGMLGIRRQRMRMRKRI